MQTNAADITDVTADTFMTEVIEKSKSVPVILDFWADWCERYPIISIGRGRNRF